MRPAPLLPGDGALAGRTGPTSSPSGSGSGGPPASCSGWLGGLDDHGAVGRLGGAHGGGAAGGAVALAAQELDVGPRALERPAQLGRLGLDDGDALVGVGLGLGVARRERLALLGLQALHRLVARGELGLELGEAGGELVARVALAAHLGLEPLARGALVVGAAQGGGRGLARLVGQRAQRVGLAREADVEVGGPVGAGVAIGQGRSSSSRPTARANSAPASRRSGIAKLARQGRALGIGRRVAAVGRADLDALLGVLDQEMRRAEPRGRGAELPSCSRTATSGLPGEAVNRRTSNAALSRPGSRAAVLARRRVDRVEGLRAVGVEARGGRGRQGRVGRDPERASSPDGGLSTPARGSSNVGVCSTGAGRRAGPLGRRRAVVVGAAWRRWARHSLGDGNLRIGLVLGGVRRRGGSSRRWASISRASIADVRRRRSRLAARRP